MDKYKKLKSNSIIFAIGNFGSSLLSFLMIPVYTHVLSTAQYGTVDFLQTTVSLLAPLIGLSLFEGTLRFSMDAEEDKGHVVSTSVIATTMLFLITIGVFFLVKNFFEIHYPFYLLIILFLTIFNMMIQNYARAADYIKTYAISGVVTSCLLVISNIVFLVIFHQGVHGYLISIIISLVGSILVNSFFTNFWKVFSFKKFDTPLLKRMLRYSVPLMPNSISWWLTSDISKFLIVYFIGVAANGQYALASKPGAILSLIFMIFSKSWQLSATDEINSPDRNDFFSDIFSKVYELHFIVIAFAIALVHPVFTLLFPASYGDAWKTVPFLLFSVMYSNFAAFMGVTYLAKKKTLNILLSTFASGILNVIVDIILIPRIGIIGAALGSLSAFLFLFIFRLVDTKKYVETKLNMPNFFGSQIALTCLTFGILSVTNWKMLALIYVVTIATVLYLNRKFIILLLGRVR